MPIETASLAWWTMCRYSPWTGMKQSGLVTAISRQLALAGVPAHVDGLGPRVDDLGPPAVQLVDDPAHRPLVARDWVGADDDHVAVVDLEPLVLAGGHERQGRHGLALGAGGDDAHLARVELVDLVDVDQRAVGEARMPSRRASSTFFCMERPRVATRRPLATAASMICWTRCTWLAKQATMTRRPGRRRTPGAASPRPSTPEAV